MAYPQKVSFKIFRNGDSRFPSVWSRALFIKLGERRMTPWVLMQSAIEDGHLFLRILLGKNGSPFPDDATSAKRWESLPVANDGSERSAGATFPPMQVERRNGTLSLA